MQVYDIQISGASDVERINAQGDYIYYSYGAAGGSSPCVEVRGINTGFRVKLLPGQGMRLPMGKVERDWMIKPDASIAGGLIGAVVIGEGEIFDNRVTGSVEVIDGSEARSFSNSFSVALGILANPTSITKIQLWNPVNSGKIIVCKRMNVSTNELAQIRIGKSETNISGQQFIPTSKYLVANNWPTSVAIGYANAITNTSQITKDLEGVFLNAGVVFEVKPDTPFIISSGCGLIIETTVQNRTLFATFDFYEKNN